MAKRQNSIDILLTDVASRFSVVERRYKEALQGQVVTDNLVIEVTNLVENMRRCLDYLALDIRERYCPQVKQHNKTYFPIRDSRPDFVGCVRTTFPGLDTSCSALHDYLESVQPYNAGGTWLRRFNQLNNSNKHDDYLTSHKEMKTGMVSVPDSKGNRGGGVLLENCKDMTFINSDVSIDATADSTFALVNHAGTRGAGRWEGHERGWIGSPVGHKRFDRIDYKFEGQDVRVPDFLRQVITGLREIICECRKYL